MMNADITEDAAEQDPKIKVKSLAKAIRLLECFSAEKPNLGISEMSEMLGYNKATVYNIASTFEAMGYLGQDPETQKYHLGLKCLHLSYIINSRMTLTAVAEPYLQKIADLTGENVYLGIPYEDKVLYLSARAPGMQISRSILGEKAPMYCTGLGKCLLAFMEPSRRPALPDTFAPFTQNTIVTKDRLLDELDRIKKRGYALDNMEHEFGISCVALPLFGQNRQILAAVSASGPSLRFDFSAVENIYQSMKTILNEIQYIY